APLPRPGRRSLRASFLAPRVKPQTAATPRRRPRSSPAPRELPASRGPRTRRDRKSTRLNSSHVSTSYAVFCLKKKALQENSGPEYVPKISQIISRPPVIFDNLNDEPPTSQLISAYPNTTASPRSSPQNELGKQ